MGFGDSTKQYLKVTGPISSSYPNTISSRLIADFVSRLKKTLPIKSNERIPEGCVIGYKLIAGSEPEFYNLGTFTRIIKKNSC